MEYFHFTLTTKFEFIIKITRYFKKTSCDTNFEFIFTYRKAASGICHTTSMLQIPYLICGIKTYLFGMLQFHTLYAELKRTFSVCYKFRTDSVQIPYFTLNLKRGNFSKPYKKYVNSVYIFLRMYLTYVNSIFYFL